jgi:hypothetical protein
VPRGPKGEKRITVTTTDRRREGVSVEAIRRPYSAPPAQGYRKTPGKPRQRIGGHAPQPAEEKPGNFSCGEK